MEDLDKFFYSYQIIKASRRVYVDYSQITFISQKNILDSFKIDLRNHCKAKLALYYHLHMQPSEIERMDYWEYELLLQDLADLLKEKNDAEKKSYDDQKSGTPNYKAPQYKQPKMPKMPKF